MVCEQLDVRCGDFLEFLVFSNHLEFTLSRTQQHGANDILMNSNSQGFQDKSNSSSDEMVRSIATCFDAILAAAVLPNSHIMVTA